MSRVAQNTLQEMGLDANEKKVKELVDHLTDRELWGGNRRERFKYAVSRMFFRDNNEIENASDYYDQRQSGFFRYNGMSKELFTDLVSELKSQQ